MHGKTLRLIGNGGLEITAHGQGGPRTKVEDAQRTQNLDQRDGQHLSAEPDEHLRIAPHHTFVDDYGIEAAVSIRSKSLATCPTGPL